MLAAYAWAGLALVAGQDLLTNPVFGFVFVWVWVGLVPISLLLGRFWRATNPLRTIHARALRRWPGIDPTQGLVRLPAPDRRVAGGRRRCSASPGWSWCSRTAPRWPCCGSGRWPGW